MVHFEHAPPEARQLLPMRIRELGLSIEGSPVAELVRRLYEELEAKGLRHFRPHCYLSDEWGSPSGEPIIGIPFYLGDPRVAHLEDAVNDIETEREIMRYLRHEAGHAFSHAWELSRTDEYREHFGPPRRPYRDDYPFIPFSHDFVRYIPGWYAQKHPDEDFAETFAVWLDPQSHWQAHYAGWPAMRKLLYVDRIARAFAGVQPPKSTGKTDITTDEMEQTIEEFYRQVHVDETPMVAQLALDADLNEIFSNSKGEYLAADLLKNHRRGVVDKVNQWTGVRRTLVRELVRMIERRLRELELTGTNEQITDLSIYITALSMTFLTGRKPLRHRRPL